jgi:hypothetical protein
MEEFFGTLTLIFGVSMAAIGLPIQVWKNYKEKKCGFNFTLVFLTIAVYGSRMAYSYIISSWYILIPDSIGLVFGGIIFFQYFLYKKH